MFCPGCQIFVGCFVRGGKNWHGMFCPGMFCPAPIIYLPLANKLYNWIKKESLTFHMSEGNTLTRVRKCAGSSELWLHVAYEMNSSLTYNLLINLNEPSLLIIMSVWI